MVQFFQQIFVFIGDRCCGFPFCDIVENQPGQTDEQGSHDDGNDDEFFLHYASPFFMAAFMASSSSSTLSLDSSAAI